MRTGTVLDTMMQKMISCRLCVSAEQMIDSVRLHQTCHSYNTAALNVVSITFLLPLTGSMKSMYITVKHTSRGSLCPVDFPHPPTLASLREVNMHALYHYLHETPTNTIAPPCTCRNQLTCVAYIDKHRHTAHLTIHRRL